MMRRLATRAIAVGCGLSCWGCSPSSGGCDDRARIDRPQWKSGKRRALPDSSIAAKLSAVQRRWRQRSIVLAIAVGGVVFALALILTAIPFALVAFKPLPTPPTLIIIGVAAAIQVLVHLRYFLHLDLTSTPRENLVAIVFTAILIFLMVGGSFWIMFDLHNRMAM